MPMIRLAGNEHRPAILIGLIKKQLLSHYEGGKEIWVQYNVTFDALHGSHLWQNTIKYNTKTIDLRRQ